MTKLQWVGVLVGVLLAGLGLMTLIGGAMHLYADHLWDDQIRAIQRQQLQQAPPKPPEK